jgi:hypothetical protein
MSRREEPFVVWYSDSTGYSAWSFERLAASRRKGLSAESERCNAETEITYLLQGYGRYEE